MSLDDAAEDTYTLTVAADAADDRLDRVLANHVQDLSRSRLKALILAGHVTVGGHTVRDPSQRVRAGDEISIVIPPPEPAAPVPETIPLDIVFEDDAIVVIDKPAGLVVHPGRELDRHTGQCPGRSLWREPVGDRRRAPPGHRASAR